MDLLRLSTLVLDRPHHVTPEAANLILGVLSNRVGIAEIVQDRREFPAASSFAGRRVVDKDTGASRGYRLTDKGVAIIPVHGELVNRGAWVGASSGLVSYEGLRHSLKNAAGDKAVRSIVLDVDSPGGMATGMLETGALVAEVAKEKPVVAVGDGLMASAAYGISAGASRIIAADSGAIGSIGTLWMHADRSRQIDRAGIKVTLIHAGARKVDGNSFAPLPEHVREERQALLNRMQDAFIAHVAAGRGLTDAKVRGTEAAVFLGTDAVALGLADATGTASDAVAEAESMSPRRTIVSVPSNRPAPLSPPAQPAAARTGTLKGKRMDVVHGEPGADSPGNGWEMMTVAQVNEAVQSLRASILAPSAAHTAAGAATSETPAVTAPGRMAGPGAERAPEGPSESPSAAYARGRSEATARIAAILGHAEATDRPAQARVIALESDLAVEQAARLLAAAPKEATAKGGSTEAAYRAAMERVASPRVPHVGGAEDRAAHAGGGTPDFRERAKAAADARFGRRNIVNANGRA